MLLQSNQQGNLKNLLDPEQPDPPARRIFVVAAEYCSARHTISVIVNEEQGSYSPLPAL